MLDSEYDLWINVQVAQLEKSYSLKDIRAIWFAYSRLEKLRNKPIKKDKRIHGLGLCYSANSGQVFYKW